MKAAVLSSMNVQVEGHFRGPILSDQEPLPYISSCTGEEGQTRHMLSVAWCSFHSTLMLPYDYSVAALLYSKPRMLDRRLEFT